MRSNSMGRSLLHGALHKGTRLGLAPALLALLLADPAAARAGGSCVIDTDCNMSPNFCRPGFCDLFGQCQYQHSDAMCRMAPNGDALYCNGDDFCNESLNGGAGGCDVNPVNCLPPTPQCNETLDQCVECLNNTHCTDPVLDICKVSTGQCVECTSSGNCEDGLVCNGQSTCNTGTGLCEDGTPITCSGNEFCSEIYQGCVECELDAQCDDGQYCNGVETCDKQGACASGVPPTCLRCNGGSFEVCTTNADCPTNVPCTLPGFCSETLDRCVQCNLNTQCPADINFCTQQACINNVCQQVEQTTTKCGDGQFCNGQEGCASSQPGSPCANCLVVNPPICAGGSQNGATCRIGVPTDCPGGACVSNEAACKTTCCTSGTPVNCDDQISCTSDSCNESQDACVHTPNDSLCNNNLFCDGVETCGPLGCVTGTAPDCSVLTTDCSLGTCNESQDQCVANPYPVGSQCGTPGIPCPCDDDDPCTRLDQCGTSGSQNGQCVEDLVEPTDPYRCVRMEWRPTTPQVAQVGQVVSVDLHLFTSGCSTPSDDCTSAQHPIEALEGILSWDPTRLMLLPPSPGVKNPEDPCDHRNPCYICNGTCVGGTQNGLPCDNVVDCAGGSCVNGFCSGGLENGLPCDTLNNTCPGGACVTSHASYNWSNSTFINDCLADQLNGPCACSGGSRNGLACDNATLLCPKTCAGGSNVGNPCIIDDECPLSACTGTCSSVGFPANDGNAKYVALPQLVCGGVPADRPCASNTGLNVTKFKFQVLAAGVTNVELQPCYGENSLSKVLSGTTPPPGYYSLDVTKPLSQLVFANPAVFDIKCTSSAQCNDQNPCTSDVCDASQNCVYTPAAGSCNDGLFCTLNDACSNGVCVGTGATCTGNGTCMGGSNPGAACTSNANCTGGWCTALSVCDEANDRCGQCLTSSNCPDGNLCTTDSCNASGLCQNTALTCDDGLACTADTCIVLPADPPQFPTPHPVCQFTPDDGLCVTGQFCTAEFCDPSADPQLNPSGCEFDHRCASADGNPCPLDDCNEAADNCGGCLTPQAVAIGSRYLKVTPAIGQGTTPIAISIEGDCEQSEVSCIVQYVQPKCVLGSNAGAFCLTDADCPKTCRAGTSNGSPCTSDPDCPGGSCMGYCDKGLLSDTPTFMTASQWGTIMPRSGGMLPEKKYHVRAICDFGSVQTLSASAEATLWIWGDTDTDGDSDFADVSAVVNAFKNLYAPPFVTYQGANVIGTSVSACGDPEANCVGQECINFSDVSAMIDAFRLLPYPCPAVCP